MAKLHTLLAVVKSEEKYVHAVNDAVVMRLGEAVLVGQRVWVRACTGCCVT